MKTYDFELLCRAMREMPNWKAISLCAASAEKIGPVIREVGLPSTWAMVQDCLNHVWSSLHENFDHSIWQKLVDSLHSAPEWGCDDSAGLPYIVAKSLDFVDFALSASVSATPAEEAAKAFSLLLEVMESFDTSTEQFPGDVAPLRTGLSFLSSEQNSQQYLLEVLESADIVSRDLIDSLHQESRKVAASVEKIVPVYVYYYLQGAKSTA